MVSIRTRQHTGHPNPVPVFREILSPSEAATIIETPDTRTLLGYHVRAVSNSRSFAGSVTGALQVKFSQT